MTELLYVWPIALAWTVVIALGAFVSYYAFRAWRTTRSRSLGVFGAGVAVMSVAAGSFWFMVYLASDNWFLAESTCTAIVGGGFAALFVSLRMRS